MALIGRIPDRSSILKRGIKGTLLATSEKVSFVPVSQAAKVKQFTYDELNYLEVKSILGWHSVTLYTEEADLRIRCIASAREVIAFYDFVNERISVAQGSSTFGAKYFLTQLRAEGGLPYQDELDHLTALDALFDEIDAPSPVSASAALKPNIPGGHPGSNGYPIPEPKKEDQKSADSFIDEGAFFSALYGVPAASRRRTRPVKIAPAEPKARTRWTVVLPVSALIALEVWWLFGLAAGNSARVDVPRGSIKSSATNNQTVDEGSRGPLARRRVGIGATVAASPAAGEPQLVEEDDAVRLLNNRFRLGKILAEQRISVGVTKEEVARAIRKDISFIDEVENGIRSMQLPELLGIMRAIQLDAGTAVKRMGGEQ